MGEEDRIWVSVETLELLLAAGRTDYWHGERLQKRGKPAPLLAELGAAIAEAELALAFANIAETSRKLAATTARQMRRQGA
jgi:hypothetical protein